MKNIRGRRKWWTDISSSIENFINQCSIKFDKSRNAQGQNWGKCEHRQWSAQQQHYIMWSECQKIQPNSKMHWLPKHFCSLVMTFLTGLTVRQLYCFSNNILLYHVRLLSCSYNGFFQWCYLRLHWSAIKCYLLINKIKIIRDNQSGCFSLNCMCSCIAIILELISTVDWENILICQWQTCSKCETSALAAICKHLFKIGNYC